MEDFYKKSKEAKLRLTPQRIAIYKAIMHDKTHPTADGVYRKINKDHPHISFDTINRTLITFTQAGILKMIAYSGHGRKYDPDTSMHHHLQCVSCGELIDFKHTPYDNITLPKNSFEGFEVFTPQVVLNGICKKCM